MQKSGQDFKDDFISFTRNRISFHIVGIDPSLRECIDLCMPENYRFGGYFDLNLSNWTYGRREGIVSSNVLIAVRRFRTFHLE